MRILMMRWLFCPANPAPTMRTTITIDDELFEQALALSEPGVERSQLLKDCIKAYIQRQTARRLAALGGQVPDMQDAPRRRDDAAPAGVGG